MRDEALSAREEAARRATEEAQGVRNEIERYVQRHRLACARLGLP